MRRVASSLSLASPQTGAEYYQHTIPKIENFSLSYGVYVQSVNSEINITEKLPMGNAGEMS